MDRYTFRMAYFYNLKFDLISQTSQFNRCGTMAFAKSIFTKILNLFKFKTYHPEKNYMRRKPN